jgi:hypothetical protein
MRFRNGGPTGASFRMNIYVQLFHIPVNTNQNISQMCDEIKMKKFIYHRDFVWPAAGAFENFLDHRHVMEFAITIRGCNDVVFKLGYIRRRLQFVAINAAADPVDKQSGFIKSRSQMKRHFGRINDL